MECVHRTSAIRHENSSHCIAYEYPMSNKEMNIGVVEISSRYPDSGYAINYTCSEMAYVLKGLGKLITETAEVDLSIGDVVYIPHGEKYYWEGNLTLVVPATPPWHLQQHKILSPVKESLASVDAF